MNYSLRKLGFNVVGLARPNVVKAGKVLSVSQVKTKKLYSTGVEDVAIKQVERKAF